MLVNRKHKYIIILVLGILALYLLSNIAYQYFYTIKENYTDKDNNTKRVAILLYGQPRDYINGFNNINNLISKQRNIQFDFFYHCWTLNKDEKYSKSAWSSSTKLDYTEDTKEKLIELYKPVLYEYELQKNDFNNKHHIDTIINVGNKEGKIKNINNMSSQLYSRQKVRNLLNNYIQKTNIKYDFIIITRFDYNHSIDLNLNDLDNSKVHVSNIHYPRKIFPDNFIIAPTNIFLEWFNMYDDIDTIMKDNNLKESVKKMGEVVHFNMEEILFAKYIFHNKTVDNVKYISEIK